MSLLPAIIDFVLAIGVLWLAWWMLASTDLFKAIVLFVAFGLFLSLIWVRLNAPDVAMAEVAIGSGFTGALLIGSLTRLRSAQVDNTQVEAVNKSEKASTLFSWLSSLIAMIVLVELSYVVLTLPEYSPGLSVEIAANLHSSGVGNPVTAVLLNYRGYDTFLELLVLLVALLGIWSVGAKAHNANVIVNPVLDSLSRVLAPVFILIFVYLVWVGAHAPGGAFQAGSVLGAAGVLMFLSGVHLPTVTSGFIPRLFLVAGVVAFVMVAIYTLLVTGKFLQYPTTQAGLLILVLEAFASISIGVILVALFLGGQTPTEKD